MAAWDPAATIEPNRRLVELFERIGDQRGGAFARGDVGFALTLLGAYEDAEKTLREVLAATQRMRLVQVAAVARVVLGLTVARLGRPSEGRALLEAAREYFERSNNARNLVMSSGTLALVLLAEGDLEAAESAARAAAEDTSSTRAIEARSSGVLAHVLVARGDVEEAVQRATHAMDLRGGRTGPDDDPIVVLAWAEALCARGDEGPAREAVRTAHADLQERAARIRNAGYRHSFLHRAYESVRILDLARRYAPGEVEID